MKKRTNDGRAASPFAAAIMCQRNGALRCDCGAQGTARPTSVKIVVDGALPRGIGLTKAQVKAAAAFFAARSSVRIGVPFREVTVVLQDDASSAEAHEAIMNVSGATDVITQGYDAMPGEAAGVYGELYVNGDQAVREGRALSRPNWSAAQELLLYVAHGMDHLSGADDHAPKDYVRMRRRELKWLKEFGNNRIVE